MKKKFIYTFLIVFTICSFGLAQEQYDPKLPGAEHIIYKQVGDKDLYLNMFYPENRGDKMPAIIFFFGGGWRGGSPKQFEQHCLYLAKRGMVAISAEYRVSSRDNTTPFESVNDAKSAIRYLRANASRLGIDPDRIASGGGSAGGHLAATTGLVQAYDEPEEDLAISSQPQLMVLFNPVLDMTILLGQRILGDKGLEISPVHHIAKKAPETLIFHGENDTTVPVEQVYRFRDKMHSFGNLCQAVIYDGQGHGFFNFGRNNNRFFKHTVYLMDKFLTAHGYLQGEPTIDLEMVE